MGVLDFLFEGTPPASVTTYGGSTTSIPKWLSDYTQGVIARGNAVAGEGYQAYGGPRIADFSPTQQQGFDLTRQNVGSYQPGMDMARSFEEQAGNTSTLGAAQPYLDRAGRSFNEARDEYMNPYIDDVVKKAELDARRSYDEVFAPKIQNQFTAAGQYGSTAHMREAARAARELTEGLQTSSQQARAGAYDEAGKLFGADATRQAGLGETAGQLSIADAGIKSQAGRDLSALAQQQHELGAADATAIGAVGQQERALDQANLDLAHKDFEEQRDYPREQVDWMSNLVKNVPYDQSTTHTNTGPMANLDYGPSGGESIASLLATIKGMGTGANGDFAWGNILGGGGGGTHVDPSSIPNNFPDLPGQAPPIDIPMSHGGYVYADGGRVDTGAIDEMLAQLRARSSMPPRPLGLNELAEFARGGRARRPQYRAGGY
jgi:hypothetical protein